MKDGLERELERVKASTLKELSSPQVQSPPPTTIHAFDVFAHLTLGNFTRCGNVRQYPITVTLVRGSDASSLASAVAPSCKLCYYSHCKVWVDDTEALRQCVTGLLASHGAAGGQQRWAYVTWYGIDNLSYIDTDDLEKRKPLPPGSCESLDEGSVEWFQAWLRSCSPDEAITNADVISC
eukprot:5127336-Amphidinium_carterae.1